MAPAQMARSARTGPQIAGEVESAIEVRVPPALAVSLSGSAGPGHGSRGVFPKDDHEMAVQIASTTVERSAGDFHSESRAAGTVKPQESSAMPASTSANPTMPSRFTDCAPRELSAASIWLCACATSAADAVVGSTPRIAGVSTVLACVSALAWAAPVSYTHL